MWLAEAQEQAEPGCSHPRALACLWRVCCAALGIRPICMCAASIPWPLMCVLCALPSPACKVPAPVPSLPVPVGAGAQEAAAEAAGARAPGAREEPGAAEGAREGGTEDQGGAGVVRAQGGRASRQPRPVKHARQPTLLPANSCGGCVDHTLGVLCMLYERGRGAHMARVWQSGFALGRSLWVCIHGSCVMGRSVS